MVILLIYLKKQCYCFLFLYGGNEPYMHHLHVNSGAMSPDMLAALVWLLTSDANKLLIVAIG
jgi:hypothetical protein